MQPDALLPLPQHPRDRRARHRAVLRVRRHLRVRLPGPEQPARELLRHVLGIDARPSVRRVHLGVHLRQLAGPAPQRVGLLPRRQAQPVPDRPHGGTSIRPTSPRGRSRSDR